MSIDVLEQVDIQQTLNEKFNVVLWNDDRTTFDFVIDVLMNIFDKDYEQAEMITMRIHQAGSAVAGQYSYEMAEEKTLQTIELARMAGYPLRVTVE